MSRANFDVIYLAAMAGVCAMGILIDSPVMIGFGGGAAFAQLVLMGGSRW